MQPLLKTISKLFFGLLPVLAQAQHREIFYTQNLELLYPGILNNATSLGHYGIGINGQVAIQHNDSSAFALTGAFPLGSRKQDIRSSGWAWGFAGGYSSKEHVTGRIASPSQYFWELMLGRGSNAADMGYETGLLGFLELSFKDERPNNEKGQLKFLDGIARTMKQHHYSLNLRMGSSFSPFGKGLVIQKPGNFSSSLFFHLGVPIKNDEWRASSIAQGIYHCATRVLCIFEFGALGSFGSKKVTDKYADDFLLALFAGPRLEYRRERHLFALNARWKYFFGANERYIRGSPAIILQYQGAF